MRPFRSLLFVPGHKPTLVDKAIASGADALILDLEDSVPDSHKDEARATVAASVRRVRGEGREVGLLVRPNAWDTGLFGQDVESVVVPGLDGLLLAKVRDADDVVRAEAVTEHVERRNGVGIGSVTFLATLETAAAIADGRSIAGASPRMAGLLGSTARDGDVARALGYEWTEQGTETLFLRSHVVLATRAAGLDYPVCGLWQDLRDLDGLRRFAEANRRLGYRGQVVIHPSHVGPVNDTFTPDAATIARYRAMIDAFAEAERRGEGAVAFDGEHIDAAHVARARDVLAYAERLSEVT